MESWLINIPNEIFNRNTAQTVLDNDIFVLVYVHNYTYNGITSDFEIMDLHYVLCSFSTNFNFLDLVWLLYVYKCYYSNRNYLRIEAQSHCNNDIIFSYLISNGLLSACLG